MPRLIIVATSREPLHLRAEHVFRVEVLETPGDGAAWDELEASPAAQLFLARARARAAVAPGAGDAAAVGAICRRLDGLPLALELAAGSLGLLSPAGLAERLGDSGFALAPGPRDAPARQQTLEATIAWSVDLLDEAERTAFTRFAVFAGGATPDAAERVTAASADVVRGLVDRSLIRATLGHDGTARLRMLATVRAFALPQLASAPDADGVAGRHARWYLDLAERSEAGLSGMESGAWMRRLDAEMPNLRAAIEWAAGHDVELGLRLVVGLADYWARLASTEGERLCEQMLARAGEGASAELLARAWLALSQVVSFEPNRGEEPAATSLALAERLNDHRAIAAAFAQLSHCAGIRGDAERTCEFAAAALIHAERAGDEALTAEALALRAVYSDTVEDLLCSGAEAERLLVAQGRVDRQVQVLMSLGYACLDLGDPHAARGLTRRALAIAERRDHPLNLCFALGNEGLAALFQGDVATANDVFRRELEIAGDLRATSLAGEAVQGLAALAADRRDDVTAALLRAAGRRAHDDEANPVVGRGLERWLAQARARLGDARWEELMVEGSGMSMEEAAALALGQRLTATT